MSSLDLATFPGLSVGVLPEPDGTQPMSAAEFRMVREGWGFTYEALGGVLSTNPRTIRRWESGEFPVPDGVRQAMEDLEDQLNGVVEQLVVELRSAREVTLTIPVKDEGSMPAACWRAIAYRVAEDVPGLYVTYGDG